MMEPIFESTKLRRYSSACRRSLGFTHNASIARKMDSGSTKRTLAPPVCVTSDSCPSMGFAPTFASKVRIWIASLGDVGLGVRRMIALGFLTIRVCFRRVEIGVVMVLMRIIGMSATNNIGRIDSTSPVNVREIESVDGGVIPLFALSWT